MTFAIDLPCPVHDVPVGTRCPGDVICRARTRAAAKTTRDENIARKCAHERSGTR